jgi:hypothetical protein
MIRRVATFAYVGIFSLLAGGFDGREVAVCCELSEDAWELLYRRTAASALSASETSIEELPVSAEVVRLEDPRPWIEDTFASGVSALASLKFRGPLFRLFWFLPLGGFGFGFW